MAAFAAVATQEGRDANTPFPLLRMVGEYLTIDQLMPPCRLRWSRRLGRPMMERWYQDANHDDVGSCFIEELHPYETLLTGTMMLRGQHPEHVLDMSTQHRGHTRNDIWFVTIIDPNFEDTPYAEAWMRRYGMPWPFVARGSVHPTLEILYTSYMRFCQNVTQHAEDREEQLMIERFHEALRAAAGEE
jgi:hypothetical protein